MAVKGQAPPWQFVSAVLVGSALIISLQNEPVLGVISSTLTVVIYGLGLYLRQRSSGISLSTPVKSSPYVVGFIFTLVAVFNVLLEGGALRTSGPEALGVLLGQVGVAMATTATGLVLRQVLVLADPQERDAAEVYETLLEQVRHHWAEFAEIERSFVTLLDEFVATRQDMFEAETKASRRFSQALSAGRDEHIAASRKHLRATDQLIEDIIKAHASLTTETKQMTSKTGQQTKNLSESMHALISKVKDGGAQIEDNLAQLSKALNRGGSHLSTFADRIKNTASATEEVGARLVEAASDFGTGAQAASEQIRGMKEDLQRISGELGAMPSMIESSLAAIGARAEAVDRSLADRLAKLALEIASVQEILDDTIKALRHKLTRELG